MCKLQICINQGEDEKFMKAEIGSTDNYDRLTIASEINITKGNREAIRWHAKCTV